MTKRLFDIKGVRVYLADIESQDFRQAIDSLRENGGVVVELDCAAMLDSEQLFDAFATAAQFPGYFGKNWPAFDDCLADLEWLPGTAYVFVLKNPQRLLEEEPTERAVFWRVINKVAATWAEPVRLGEWWDRNGIPFHVVMGLPSEFAITLEQDKASLVGVEAALLDS